MLSKIEENSSKQSAFVVDRASGLNFIEQLQIFVAKPCKKEKVPYLIGVNENVKVAVLSKATCKMWDCEACGARNAARWIAKIINGINRLGGEWSFLTITSHEKARKSASILNLRNGWKKLYNRILAKFDKTANGIFYAKIWEQHKDGTFHLHLLVSFEVSERWLKSTARQCGMGYQAKVITISNAGQVAGYIAKYTLKNSTHSRNGVLWPKGLRRIETSQKWPELPNISVSQDMGWIVKFSRDEQLASANNWHLRGFDILDTVKETVL